MFFLFLNEKTVFPAEGQMFGAVLKFIGIEEGDDEESGRACDNSED